MAPDPVTTALPSIALAPAIQASLVSQIELLDKSKNNWTKWKRVVVQCLGMVGLDDYLTGSTVCPDATKEPRAAQNWRTNDKVVRSFIGLKSAEEEQEYIENQVSAAAMWTVLKDRHKKEGPITQILLIQEALNVRYSKSERLSATSTKLSDLNSRIFAMGIPTKDVFLSILMLNSLSGELSNVRDHVATSLSASDTFTSNNIRKRLDTEQQIIDSDTANSSSRPVAETLIANARRTGSTKECSNCKAAGRRHIGHTDKTCYHPGGAMEGQRDRVEREHEANRKNRKPTQSGTRFDNGRRAFILDKDTGEAYLLAGTDKPASGRPVPTDEFAGLASDVISRSFLDSQPDYDKFEYEALTLSDDLKASVDWSDYTCDDLHVADFDLKVTTGSRSRMLVDPGLFFLDTGATVHIMPIASDFFDLQRIAPRSVHGVGGSSIQALGIGSIKLVMGRGAHILLENVLFIPSATVRLISVGALCRSMKFIAHFDEFSCWLTKRNGTRVATGILGKNRALYSLTGNSPLVDHAFLSHRVPDLASWHRRLGRTNYHSIVEMARGGLVQGMPIDLSTEPGKCEHCVLGKQVRTPVPKVRTGLKADRRLGIVYVDLTGPEAVKLASGNLYSMNIIDDFSSYIWCIPLPSISAAAGALCKWELAREVETGSKIGIFRVDNGELKSNEMAKWFESCGTIQQFTAPHTSAHNGQAERVHCTLRDKARTMRLQCNIPMNRWDEFMLSAAYLTCRVPSQSLEGQTPYEAFYGVKPDLSHLHEIGSCAFILIQNKHNPKLYERSVECVLIGYELSSKAYQCFHRGSQRVFSSYHVVFIESHDASP